MDTHTEELQTSNLAFGWQKHVNWRSGGCLSGSEMQCARTVIHAPYISMSPISTCVQIYLKHCCSCSKLNSTLNSFGVSVHSNLIESVSQTNAVPPAGSVIGLNDGICRAWKS